MSSSIQDRWLRLSLILGVVLLAAVLRLWQLPLLPPGFWRDEAYNAMDARWMWQHMAPQVFLIGNTGREPLFHYFGALSMFLFGAQPYVFRLAASFLGIVTVPLFYRWQTTLFAAQTDRHWLALLAAAGLSVSLWHVMISRSGYRAVLVPLFFIAMSYLFWLAWTHRSWLLFVAAGLTLGLSQYSYLVARLFPLVLVGFALLWLVFSRRSAGPVTGHRDQTASSNLWRGLLIMAATSFLVFLPLGLYFWQHPAAFISRSANTFLFNQADLAGVPVSTVLQSRFLDALRIFYDGVGDIHWRHTLVGEPGFDWLMRLGFWLGLVVALKNFRQPRYLWLLVSVVVLWLPVVFSDVSTLRLSGYLVPYYALMAAGWTAVVRWLANRWPQPFAGRWTQPVLVALLLLVGGGSTVYGYFSRWATESAVYPAFDGPVVDLTRQLIDRSHTHDLLLPLEYYTHPTVRFLLDSEFSEVSAPPPLDPTRPAIIVSNVAELVDLPPDTPTHTYVWLTRQPYGGAAYVLAPFSRDDVDQLEADTEAVFDLLSGGDQKTADLMPLTSAASFIAATDRPPNRQTDFNWDHQLQLVGYDVLPARVSPGRSPILNLYWQNLSDQPFPYNIFVQLIDNQGRALAQWTDGYLADQHRWRKGMLTPTQHHLWLDPQIAPGPYLVRLGLFDATTGQRVPILNAAGDPIGDQVQIGLFYVDDPCPGLEAFPATLGQSAGDQIQFLGYSLPAAPGQNKLPVCLAWQADRFVSGNYTIFLQLLNEQGQRVAGVDSPPLSGNYPTSVWSPGETVVDQFDLPLPETLPPGRYRLVTGLYNFTTGERLPVTIAGQPQPDEMIILRETKLR